MSIVIGNASSASNNGGSVAPGDAGQNSTPDFKGEVKLVEYASDEALSASHIGWLLTRPANPSIASAMAQNMITACNNPNIGYQMGGKGMWVNGGGNRVNTGTPTTTDCAALVCECVAEAIGTPFYEASAGLAGVLSHLTAGGGRLFCDSVSITSSTKYCDGDVISHPGHALMVVSGGSSDNNLRGDTILEVATSSGIYGDGIDSPGYLEVNVDYSFIPRMTKPKPSHEGYGYYIQQNGVTENGRYAWGRFAEVCKSEQITLSKGAVRKWYAHTEDGYKRGVSPSLGAIMCFVPRNSTSKPGFAAIVEVVHSQYVNVSYVDASGKFQYEKWKSKYHHGTWNIDIGEGGSNNVADHMFQGFIYPPNVSDSSLNKTSLQRFLDIANSYLESGDGKKFTVNHVTSVSNVGGWSAAFITACARKANGLLDVIIPDVISASSIGFEGVKRGYGEWRDGPANNGSCAPQVGDIALFRTVEKPRFDNYSADKAGIVIKCATKDKDNTDPEGTDYNKKYKFFIIMGDCGGTVKLKEYHNTSGQLAGIFRPFWYRVDGTAEITKWATSPIGMYNEGTTIEDAAIRDVAYAKKKGTHQYKPSIKETGITISAINYTGMLSNLYSVLAEVRASQDSQEESLVPSIWDYTALSQYRIDIFATEPFPATYPTRSKGSRGLAINGGDGYSPIAESSTVLVNADGTSVATSKGNMVLNGQSRAIYNSLYAELQNRGAVCGIMANMWQESSWNPAAISFDGGHGLIQWTNTSGSARATAMKNYCGADWSSNISKQIQYLFKEARENSHYSTGMSQIRGVPDTVAGARSATVLFLRYFELGKEQWGSNKESTEITRRQPFAEACWALFVGA